MHSKPLSLAELNRKIKNVLNTALETRYWVVGEISELKENFSSGHCYLELVEKDEKNDDLVARSRATIWAMTYRMIKPYFETTTGAHLAAGIKILVRVSVEFHEVYGLSLNISDIEPSYTVGELARKKLGIINRLTEEGVIDMNRELDFPVLPKRVAVISSKTAAGFGDFEDQLLNNPFGYSFHITLFQAFMQGENAVNSMVEALDRIHCAEEKFDVVVIIRGGGSQVDLDCFNSYWLALHVAQFPVPVITGIGHEQDDTVTDRVAHLGLKTPTAVAEFLIDRFQEAEEYYTSMGRDIALLAGNRLQNEHETLLRSGIILGNRTKKLLSAGNKKIDETVYRGKLLAHRFLEFSQQQVKDIVVGTEQQVRNRLRDEYHTNTLYLLNLEKHLKNCITTSKHRLDILEKRKTYLDPAGVFSRGYSITLKEGKVVKSALALQSDDNIKTFFPDGSVKSRVFE